MNKPCRILGSIISALIIFIAINPASFSAPAAAVTAQAASMPPSAPEAIDDDPTALPISQPIADPFQRYNRAVFSFNDKFDTHFMKPVAEAYDRFMPPPIKIGVHNVFNNVYEVTNIANDLLQLHLYQFANDAWRFVINTTVGIGGLFDVASHIGLPRYQNDFGLTLAQYGYHNSAYWVWPFLGSYTIRDGIIGLPVDYYIFSPYAYIWPKSTRYGILALYFIDYRASLLQYQSLYDEAAIDRYIFVRNTYVRHRNFQIEQNKHRGLSDLYSGGRPHRFYMSSMPTG